MATVIRADKIKEDTLEDKDSDTKVTVEESADEDKIRFDTAGTQRMIIDETGQVGIGTETPGTQVQLEGSDPYLTLKNSTSEHTEGGAESKIIFEDHSDTALAQIQASHDGTSDDTKGDLIFSTHDGSSLNEALRIDSGGHLTFQKGYISSPSVLINGTDNPFLGSHWVKFARQDTDFSSGQTSQGIFLITFAGREGVEERGTRSSYVVTVKFTASINSPYYLSSGTYLTVDPLDASDLDGFDPTADIAITYESDSTPVYEIWVKSRETHKHLYCTYLGGTNNIDNANYTNLAPIIQTGQVPASSITSLGNIIYGTFATKTYDKVGIATSTPISELDVAGKISITSESDTPSQPSDGQGYLYTKSDGKLYWRSYDLSETDLTAGGSSGISHDGSTANGVLTYKDSDEATVEPYLTFDGSSLKLMSSADTGDYFTLTVGSAGTMVAATNDDDGSAADLTFDVDGTIYLDSYDYGYVILREGAQEYLRFERRGSVGQNDAIIKNMEDGMDIIFQQYDGTETLRLTDAGNATIAADLTVTGDIILDDGGSIKEAGGTAAITIDGSGHVTKIGQDSPSSDEVLTWDGSKAVWSAAGGSSSSEYFHLHLSGRVRNTNGNLHGHAAYAYNAGDADWTTSLSSYVSNWTTGDSSFDATYANAMLYFTIGVAPAAMDLGLARIAYYMANDDMTDDFIWEIWKATPTSGTAYSTTLSWSRVGQLDRGGDPSSQTFYATSNTFSSSNSLAAGDLIGLTVHNPGDTYTSKYHAYHLALRFTYT